jgi:hypothetical protein
MSGKLWCVFFVLEMAFLFPQGALSLEFQQPGGQSYSQLIEHPHHFLPADINIISGVEIPEELSEKEEEETEVRENIKNDFSSLWLLNSGRNGSDYVLLRLSLFSKSHVFTSFSSLYLLYCCLKTCHVV